MPPTERPPGMISAKPGTPTDMTSSTRDTDLDPAAATTAAPGPADAFTGGLLTQVTALAKGELKLVRAELTTKGKRAGVGAGLAGAGGVVAPYGEGPLLGRSRLS